VIVIAQQRNMVTGFLGGIVVLCHRTKATLFERSHRDGNPSRLLDDDAFLPFQGKGVDSSASSALTAKDADDFVQSSFVTEFMPVDFEDVEFRDVAETGQHLGVCSADPEQVARVARASAAGPALFRFPSRFVCGSVPCSGVCSAARTNVVFTYSYVDNNSSLISE
jgi:hypothetical protein